MAEIFFMKNFANIKVLFIAGFATIVKDDAKSQKLYLKTLGLPLKNDNGYCHSEQIEGVKHFGLWPLSQAAESCFGKKTWPKNLPIPQACVEFEVEDIETATAELKAQGYKLLVAVREEPWGQTVTRFLGPEGLLVGVTNTPSMRQ
jgi:catechol 2,3-dioxygenase-like lactoylglutathione lyase family enzyme